MCLSCLSHFHFHSSKGEPTKKSLQKTIKESVGNRRTQFFPKNSRGGKGVCWENKLSCVKQSAILTPNNSKTNKQKKAGTHVPLLGVFQ